MGCHLGAYKIDITFKHWIYCYIRFDSDLRLFCLFVFYSRVEPATVLGELHVDAIARLTEKNQPV